MPVPPNCHPDVSQHIHPISAYAGVAQTHLRNQDPVSHRHAHRQALPLFIYPAGADGQDFGLVELLLRRLGDEDAAGGLGLGFEPLHEDAVEEGGDGFDGFDGGGLGWGVLLAAVMGRLGGVEEEEAVVFTIVESGFG